MSGDNHDVLESLKSELSFLENGGYRVSPRMPGRAKFILEDSPTCLNYGSIQRQLPCIECAWMRFVPRDCCGERIPCKHIPLNVEGYTVDTFYRLGTQEELEVAWAGWLRKTIRWFEGESAQQPGESRAPKPAVRLRSLVGRLVAHAPTTVVQPKGNELASSQPNKAGSLTAWGGILLALFLLNGVGAIAGGIAVMRDAMPFPNVWLQGTPFHSYFIPGLILFLAVGGSQFAGAYAIFRCHPLAERIAMFSGLVLTGWMIGELALIGFQAPIQVWFAGVGLLEFGWSFARLRHSKSRVDHAIG